MMKSLGAAVRISNGRPPAARIASLTSFAMPSRWLKQIASSEELLTTAILGFSMSSSERPSAFHCARRAASRGEPGSKLLRRVFFIWTLPTDTDARADGIRWGKPAEHATAREQSSRFTKGRTDTGAYEPHFTPG